MTVEFYDCDARVLADSNRMQEIFTSSARKSGATVISSHFHSFMPQGVSGVVVISESHFAVHAWPEHEYAAVDLFTCGENVDFNCAVESLAAGMGSEQWVISSLIDRGIVGNNGVERLVPVTESRECHSFQLSWRSRFEKTSARGLSVAVDLYECRCESDSLSGKLEKIVSSLGFQPDSPCREMANGDSCKFIQSLAGGWLNGVWDRKSGIIHLDLYNESFFDPRSAAETALTVFGSAFYRMQPCVRQ